MNHDIIHTAYYPLDEYGTECELTCACRLHVNGIGSNIREAKHNAEANHQEHRSLCYKAETQGYAWAERQAPILAQLPPLSTQGGVPAVREEMTA